jgi:uncharacterized membrane protein
MNQLAREWTPRQPYPVVRPKSGTSSRWTIAVLVVAALVIAAVLCAFSGPGAQDIILAIS